MKQLTRNQKIVRAGAIGIAVNVLMAAFKAAVGLLSHSVAILLDAVNNLSDALTGAVTVAGAKLAAKPADRKHPLGYGRVEYLSALLISCIVLFAGAASLSESVQKILAPVKAEYTPASFLILAAAVAGKLLLGRYTIRVGRETNSESLSAAGTESLLDVAVTSAALFSAAASLLWKLNLDGWVGAVIALVILKAGFEMLSDTLNDILGRRVTPETSRRIREEVLAEPGVLGAFDLFLDSYGPQKLAGSVHLEVPDTMTAREISALTRSVSARVFRKFGAVITCGIYAVETDGGELSSLRRDITACALRRPGILQIHGLYADRESGDVNFDAVVDFSVRDPDSLLSELAAELTALHPEYRYHIHADLDLSD